MNIVKSKMNNEADNTTIYSVSDGQNTLFFTYGKYTCSEIRRDVAKQLSRALVEMLDDDEILRGAKQWVR